MGSLVLLAYRGPKSKVSIRGEVTRDRLVKREGKATKGGFVTRSRAFSCGVSRERHALGFVRGCCLRARLQKVQKPYYRMITIPNLNISTGRGARSHPPRSAQFACILCIVRKPNSIIVLLFIQNIFKILTS